MKSLCVILLITFAAAAFFGCGAPPANLNDTRGSDNASVVSADAPTVETLKALETKAYEAYRNKDGKFFEGFLTDEYGGSGTGRRLNKAATVKMIVENKCDVKSFSFADETLTKVGATTAVFTTKVAVDGSCEGRKMPAQFISASVFVRKGSEWKVAWHGEVPVVDPKAPSAGKNSGGKNPGQEATYRIMPDSEARELAAIERSVWEGWMNRDGAKLDSLTAGELAFVNIFGDFFRNRADTLKNWSENPCEITSVDVGDPTSVSVTPDTSILFHKGTANGTCFGQKVDPILGTSIYVKDGSAWKLAFTMNMPAS